MTAETAIGMALLLPLIAAGTAVLLGKRPNVREFFTLVIAIALFPTVASLAPEVMAGERPGLTLFEVLPGLSIAFEIEPLGLLFAFVAAGLGATLYVERAFDTAPRGIAVRPLADVTASISTEIAWRADDAGLRPPAPGARRHRTA